MGCSKEIFNIQEEQKTISSAKTYVGRIVQNPSAKYKLKDFYYIFFALSQTKYIEAVYEKPFIRLAMDGIVDLKGDAENPPWLGSDGK